MSETENTESVSTEQPVQQEQKEEQATETQEAKPEGYDLVDIPDDLKPRFNYVYKEMKTFQRDNTVVKKENQELKKIAQQQFEIIEQLRQGQNQIVNHLQESDYAQAENILKSQRQEAYNKGDLAAVDDINDRIADIKIQRKLAEKESKQQPAQPQRGANGADVVNIAVQRGSITPQDADVYRAWANEVDDYGNLKRPWVNETDTRNRAAGIEGQAVFNNPSFANKSFAEKLKEIDRRMGVANRQAAGSNVLPGGNLTRAKSANTIKLTPYQEKIAVKTRFAGPGKTSEEHLEAFRKQVAQESSRLQRRG